MSDAPVDPAPTVAGVGSLLSLETPDPALDGEADGSGVHRESLKGYAPEDRWAVHAAGD